MSVFLVNSKSDLGTEISTRGLWLDITQLKIKKHLVKKGDNSFKGHESHAVKYHHRQAGRSCDFIGYVMKYNDSCLHLLVTKKDIFDIG